MFWILSMNDRNLNYIKKLNPKSSINLADNKVETKLFLQERWIWVARTIAIISSKKDLSKFDFSSIKEKHFVIKPVSWSKWNGILIIENLGNLKYKIWEKIYDENYLTLHMYDILNWDFSLNYWYDKVLIEEKMIPWNWFERFCDFWLADIRVIVYNMVPVAAMVRMPTELSEWKANLAQGWIWLWIEVWTWKIYTFYQKWKTYKKEFPAKYLDLKDFYLPFWDDILEASSKTQFFVNLWFLALDWVVTDSWPKILEINARAWIEIQNVSLLPLKKRLEKLKDLKIQEPEKWVELAKSLFSENVSTWINSWKVIYLEQYSDLIINWEKEEIIVKVDLKNNKNIASNDIRQLVKSKDFILEIWENLSFENLKFKVDNSLEDGTFILWSESLRDYYVRPVSNLEIEKIFIPKKINKNELDILKTLDEKVIKLDRKFSLISNLRPINFLWELDKFVEMKWEYNPKFEYKFLNDEKIWNIKENLNNIKNTYFKKDLELKSEFAKIFLEKLLEIENSIDLIEAYKIQNFEKIDKLNKKLYWEVNEKLLEKSKQKIWMISDKSNLGKVLDLDYVIDYIKKYIENISIKQQIKVIPFSSSTSRISVNRRKWRIEIRVDANWIFREKELDWIIAHEIWVHLLRYINWKNTWWEIFTSWTANYLATEEGLAVYNSLKYLPEDYEKNAMFQNYYLVEMAKKLDFKDLAKIVFQFYWNDYVKVFKITTRFKRWIEDTSMINKWAYCAKDKVYLDWFYKVRDWIKDWWNIEKLMLGKIKISDLEYIY